MLVTRYARPQLRGRQLDLFNELFDRFVETSEGEEVKRVSEFVPAVNTREGKNAYHIDVDLPGVNKEDVEISVDKNILSVSGKRETRDEVKKDDYYRIESAYGRFSRSFTLPENVDIENIRAASEDGVLEIIIPKLEVLKESTKKIEIQ
ncbi:Hsp20/alpha crystallin family protein [Sulfurimonas sp.]